MTQFNPDDIKLPSTIPANVSSTIRLAVMWIGGWAIGKGYVTSNQVVEIVTFAAPVAMALWAFIKNHNASKALSAAIQAPAGKAS